MINYWRSLAISRAFVSCYDKFMDHKPVIGILVPKSNLPRLFSKEALEALASIGECRMNPSDEHLSEAQTIGFLKDAEIAIGSWGTPRPSAEILDACPRLRYWQHVAGSVKGYFGPHMEGRDLVIASCAPAIADSVAEMTIGELIFGLRRFLLINQVYMGKVDEQPPVKVNLFRSTVGVVGASQVGRRVIRLLKAFDARVVLYDPFVDASEAEALGVSLESDLVELFRRSDAVTLHTPNLPETQKMIGARHFSALRDHGVFINTSRGECVDQAALFEALKARPLYAFIDVLDPKHEVGKAALSDLPNCFLTPHVAGGPNQRMGDQTVDDIKAFLSGGEPMMAVDASQLSRLA